MVFVTITTINTEKKHYAMGMQQINILKVRQNYSIIDESLT